jgi:acid ceramidase
MKPGKFSITLNAVSSTEKPNLAPPVTFLIREVLENADSFQEALQLLSETEIASDCLLMLVGANMGEQVVIERTPRKFALRYSEENHLVVTNDYRQFNNDTKTGDVLQQTSCGRFDRASELIAECQPQTAAECLSILSDANVKMGITVQQMVFDLSNSTIMVQ